MNTPDTLDVALGNRIRKRRKDLGVSQAALALAIGITFQQIQKYENGFNRVSFSRLVKIARALDWRVGDLVGDLDRGVGDTARRSVGVKQQIRESDLLAAFAQVSSPLQKVMIELIQSIPKDGQGPPV